MDSHSLVSAELATSTQGAIASTLQSHYSETLLPGTTAPFLKDGESRTVLGCT